MRFASREKGILSQWEVGAGLVPGGGPMARLPRLIGRGRALEVLLGADDINGDLAERYGYVNRALPDSELDGFVDALAMRIASFDKEAIAETKRLVNVASLPSDAEIRPEWDAFIASLERPATQKRIEALMQRGFHRAGDVENRLGFPRWSTWRLNMIHHRIGPRLYDSDFSRRSLLVRSAAEGGSLILVLRLPFGWSGGVGTESIAPNAFIRIDGDGKVILRIPDVEMQQGISITILIAEELEVAPKQVRLEHAPRDERIRVDPVGSQASGESNAVHGAWNALREAAASARSMLLSAAAKRWDVDPRSCHAHQGEIIHTPTWRKLKYGVLAADAAYIPIPRDVVLKRAE